MTARDRDSSSNQPGSWHELLALLEAAGDGIFVAAQPGGIVWANRRFASMTGYSVDQLAVPQGAARVLPPGEIEKLLVSAGEEAPASEPRLHRLLLSTRDGRQVLVEVSAVGATWHGAPATLAIVRDVSQHHRTEERLQLALDGASDGMFDWNMQTGEAYFSPRYLTMLGYEADELPHSGETWERLVHPQDKEVVGGLLQEFASGLRDHHEVEYRMRRKGGGWQWVLSRARLYARDEAGRPLRMVGTHMDISERRLAADRLRAAEQRFRSLLEHTSEAVFCYEYDPPIAIDLPIDEQVRRFHDAVLVDCNLLCAHLYGAQSREEVLGRKLTELFGTMPGSLDRLFREMVHGGYRTVDGLGVEELADGSKRYHQYNAYGVVEAGMLRRVWGMSRDVTEQKRAEEELQKAQRLESLGVLAGGIAHDFNNLLSGMFGYVELARDSVEPGTEMADLLDRASHAYARAKDLTRQLLTFARGGTPVKQPVPVETAIQQAVDLALSGSSSRPELVVEEPVDDVDADPGQLNQVLSNVLLNARQAMPGGGVIRVRAVTASAAAVEGFGLAPGRYVEIAISDHGLGIPAQHLPRIFDPFFTTKQEGSGLGLAMAYSIVTHHQGRIAVESEPGVGTTVRILLPAATRRAEPVPKPVRWTGAGRVLVMDDEPTVRDVVKRMLVRLGFVAEVAPEGASAVRIYREALGRGERFDAVILDLTVPGGMSGEETMSQLRELDPEIRAVASSGYSDEGVAADHRGRGFAAFLGKPYRLDKLATVLRDVLTATRSGS